MEKPLAIFYGGTNGSGKSELRLNENRHIDVVIDPDAIAKELNPANPEKANLEAGRASISLFKETLASHKSLSMESTLSGKGSLKRLSEAAENGYKVELHYVGLEFADLNVERVKSRVASGGHDIEEHLIRKRYDESRENLLKAIKVADTTIIYDNSGTTLIPALVNEKGEINELNNIAWVDKFKERIQIEPIAISLET